MRDFPEKPFARSDRDREISEKKMRKVSVLNSTIGLLLHQFGVNPTNKVLGRDHKSIVRRSPEIYTGDRFSGMVEYKLLTGLKEQDVA
jgi:hypothetical protein